MKIHIRDIGDDPKELSYDEPCDELNVLLSRGATPDYECLSPVHVDVRFYRAGHEFLFEGTLSGPVLSHCARCLEDFVLNFERDVHFVVAPAHDEPGAAALEEDDLDLSYYRGEEINLSPLLREQVLLALPTRPLCRDNCKGLCPQCGINRNEESCSCSTERRDPRWAALSGLKVSR